MNDTLRSILKPLLGKHEGRRQFPYTDTVGKLTIGIGRNLTDRGLSDDEIDYLFENDLKIAERDARRVVGTDIFDKLNTVRQAVLVDMAFNLGYLRLKGFHNTLLAVQQGRYNDAAAEMLTSKWATQVGQRAKTLAAMMRDG